MNDTDRTEAPKIDPITQEVNPVVIEPIVSSGPVGPLPPVRPKRMTLRNVPFYLTLLSAFLSIVGIASGLTASYFTFFQADEHSSDSTYVAFVQSRIESCIAFSVHHRLQADRDRAAGYVEGLLLTLENGEKEVMTGNEDRFLASAVLARGLVMCTVERADVEGLRRCVEDVTTNNIGVKVYDHMYDDGPVHVGKENPAC